MWCFVGNTNLGGQISKPDSQLHSRPNLTQFGFKYILHHIRFAILARHQGKSDIHKPRILCRCWLFHEYIIGIFF